MRPPSLPSLAVLLFLVSSFARADSDVVLNEIM